MTVNASEAYLTSLARKSFLSLWSYPNPGFGNPASSTKGKELCDLLVLFDNTLILFSDKQCEFPNTANAHLDWKRWYRRAVFASAKQLNGAKRILLRSPERIHRDLSLKLPFPLALPPMQTARLFLIAVAHGSKDACEREHHRHSLALDTSLAGDELRLAVGCMFDGQIIHVLDDSTLETLFAELDTISDFIAYLTEKEAAFSARTFFIPGEENLLAIYMKNHDGLGKHSIPAQSDLVAVRDGEWNSHKHSEAYRRSQTANRISYNIDVIVEHFINSYESGQMVVGDGIDFAKHEKAMRLMASESRFGRRIISASLVSILDEPNANSFWASTIASTEMEGVRYVFLTYPQPPSEMNIEVWEEGVSDYLMQHILIARYIFRDSKIIIGVGIPNRHCRATSHFIRVFNGESWTPEDFEEAEKLQRSTGIFSNIQEEKFFHIE